MRGDSPVSRGGIDVGGTSGFCSMLELWGLEFWGLEFWGFEFSGFECSG